MADGITIQCTGDRDLVAAFRDLAEYLPKTAVRAALRKGADMIASDARADAPVGIAVLGDEHPGRLRDNITVKTKMWNGGQSAKVVVNTKGDKDSGANAFYWRFVEYGHTAPNGTVVPPNPFITQAFEANQHSASQAVFDAADKSIKRAEAKAHRAQANLRWGGI